MTGFLTYPRRDGAWRTAGRRRAGLVAVAVRAGVVRIGTEAPRPGERLGESVEQTEPRSAPLQSDHPRERNAPESERVLPKGVTAPMDRPQQQAATDAVSNARNASSMAPLSRNARQQARAALPDEAAAPPADSKPLAGINRGEPRPSSNPRPMSAQALPAAQHGPRFRAEPPQAPLSDAALAGRNIAARERPSIVQVTIDRIDVRAPSSPAARKAATARPAAAGGFAVRLSARWRKGRAAMSSPLAIGAVSAVLRNLLDNGLIEAGAAMGTTVNVSAVAPDTDRSRQSRRYPATERVPAPGDAEPGMAECRTAVAQRDQRRAPDQRAARAGPALRADGLWPDRLRGRDTARLRHASSA